MWYWTLPSLALTGACLALPYYVNAGCNFAATGHVHRKNLEADSRDFYMYLRDRRVSGSEYKQQGLEYLDKPVDPSRGLNGWIFNERMAIPTKQ